MTPADIVAEHNAALSSLTFEQKVALQRLEDARRRMPFAGRSFHEHLRDIFAEEAERRNQLQ